jgi:hypothetical protein
MIQPVIWNVPLIMELHAEPRSDSVAPHSAETPFMAQEREGARGEGRILSIHQVIWNAPLPL